MRFLLLSLLVLSLNSCFDSDRNKKSVLILSAPRTTSTLLYRFFSTPGERGDLGKKVVFLLEPTTQVYHDKICEEVPGYNPQENWPHTHQEVMSLLGQADDHFVVAKDLAYQTSFSIKELKWLAEKYHILFLIRHPKKTILSNLYPYYQEGTVDSFKESSLGYKELGTLFARFQEETGITPWVIEAENYLKDPKQQLSKYFNKFGIKWKDSYLKLKPKTKEEKQADPAYLVWPDWYKNAYTSTGIIPNKSFSNKPSPYAQLMEEEKEQIAELLKGALPAYTLIKERGKRP